MPELPEVEITARRLGEALAGAEVESTLAPGMVAVKTLDPPLTALEGMKVSGTGRVGKMPIVRFSGDEELELLVHLMSAGRLQVFDKRASLKDRASRVLIRLADAIDHYEKVIGETVPDKLPMPLRVHRREGEPSPRCETTIEAVYFAEHQTNYCPHCQTGGKVLKDRRLSRLLK
jgi:formamidopyrimidine-DNA glycosylase